MVPRRAVLSGMVAAGVAGAGLARGAHPAEAVVQSKSAGEDVETTSLLRQIVTELREQRRTCDASACAWTEKVRAVQRQFFRANAKFPDFIDIGIDVWERVYDWHVQAQQQINVTRLADGRFAIAFMLTTLVLRADVGPDFVSLGYDAK